MGTFETKEIRRTKTQKLINLAAFLAVSSAIQMAENLVFPSSLFFRPGLANIITILVIITCGPGDAVLLATGRTVLASVITGKFLSIPFFLSFWGAVASAVVMGYLYGRIKGLGLVGLSVIGAIVHNLVQLVVVFITLSGNSGVLALIPWLWASALFSGVLVGIVSIFTIDFPIFKNLSQQGGNERQAVKT